MSDPEYQQIRYELHGPEARIVLHRPEAMNAWTPRMGREVRHAVGRAEHDRRVVAIVVTGSGRGFCAGADMNVLQMVSEAGLKGVDAGGSLRSHPGQPDWGHGLHEGELTYLLSVCKPVIAAINGAVVGMALPFVLACDLRFIADEAFVMAGFSARGLVAEWGTSWLLPRLIGPSAAMDLLFSSRRVGGQEALHLGLANRSVPLAELLDVTHEYVEGLASSAAPTSLAAIKRQVQTQMHSGFAAAEREARTLMEASLDGDDFKEGIQAFRERRPPRFARIGDAPGDE